MSSPEELRDRVDLLHSALLAGDETSTSRIAELVLPFLLSSLSREFLAVRDPHLVVTAVHDALSSYFNHPERHNPAKAPLLVYLRMSARGDLLNSLKQRSIEEARIAADVEDRTTAPEQYAETEADSD